MTWKILKKELERTQKKTWKDLEKDFIWVKLEKELEKDLERLGKLLCQINTFKLRIPIAFMYNNFWFTD